MFKYFLEEENADQLDDEVDVTLAASGEDEPLDDSTIKEAAEDTEDVDISCCMDNSSRDEEEDMNNNVDKIDITIDTDDTATKADILDISADDLVDAVENVTFDDFDIDDMIDASKQLDVAEVEDESEPECDSDGEPCDD